MLTVETPKPATAPSVRRSLAPLVLDVVVPVGGYYLLRYGCHLSLVTALVAASAVPILRTVAGVARDRTINGLAALMLAVNLVGIVLSYVSGDPRLMFAKDSGISSVIAAGMLLSVLRGAPVMTAGLRPWVTKGRPEREAAWERLAAGSAEFDRYTRRYTLIWGAALLAECAARLSCAFTVPLPVLGWLASALVCAAIAVAIVVGGGAAAEPLERLVRAETETRP